MSRTQACTCQQKVYLISWETSQLDISRYSWLGVPASSGHFATIWCFCSFTHLRRPRSPPKFTLVHCTTTDKQKKKRNVQWHNALLPKSHKEQSKTRAHYVPMLGPGEAAKFLLVRVASTDCLSERVNQSNWSDSYIKERALHVVYYNKMYVNLHSEHKLEAMRLLGEV